MAAVLDRFVCSAVDHIRRHHSPQIEADGIAVKVVDDIADSAFGLILRLEFATIRSGCCGIGAYECNSFYSSKMFLNSRDTRNDRTDTTWPGCAPDLNVLRAF